MPTISLKSNEIVRRRRAKRTVAACLAGGCTPFLRRIKTRERIRALGGDTYEETIIQALELLEAERYWAQADDAAAWRPSLADQDRARLAASEADVDVAFDGIG